MKQMVQKKRPLSVFFFLQYFLFVCKLLFYWNFYFMKYHSGSTAHSLCSVIPFFIVLHTFSIEDRSGLQAAVERHICVYNIVVILSVETRENLVFVISSLIQM